MTDQSQPDERRWRAPAVVLVAVLAIVLVVTGGVALVTGGLPRPSGSPSPTQPAGPDGFPSEVLGVPVISVGDALALTDGGGVDGRALAVAGWWLPDFAWSCPWPGRDALPIEGYCTIDYLSSAPYQRVTCHNNPDGSGECHGNPVPSGVQVMPAMTLQETASAERLGRIAGARFDTGIPVVLIVHVGDLRWRQCPVDSQDACSTKALVDGVAWAAGEDVEGGPRINLVTAMTPDEAIFASRFEGTVLTALPVRLGEAWLIDPRFHGIGNDPVWVIRGLSGEPAGLPEDPSRTVDVRLVDDATARVLFAGRMAPAPAYAPARLLVQATELRDAAGSNVAIYYRVETTDGPGLTATGLLEARMGGTIQSGDDPTAHSVGTPAVLEPGDYLVRVWRALVPGDGHAHFNECTQVVSLAALGEVQIEAAFPSQGDCTFVTPTFENDFDR